MFGKGKFLLILLVLCELCIECRGKWCEVTETEHVLEKKQIQVKKYRKDYYKCNWFSLNKSCYKLVPYYVTETKEDYVPKDVMRKVCCSGYAEELGTCKPICETSCSNARCIAPNTCKCNNGYKIFSKEAPYKCVPSCNGCEFGVCLAPEVCKCASGYMRAPSYHSSKCIPHCKDACPRGGTCTQPDTCTCLLGFRTILKEGKLRCLAEGETEEPPTTTTEATTEPTTVPTTTTEASTSTTTVSSTSTANVPQTTTESDSTDYSEIEEIPDDDPTNSTLYVQLHNAENDSSVEIVTDDPWMDEIDTTTNQSHHDVIHEEIEEKRMINSILGKIWYFLLAIILIICAIMALKFYLRMQTKEYSIDNENDVQVYYISSKSEL